MGEVSACAILMARYVGGRRPLFQIHQPPSKVTVKKITYSLTENPISPASKRLTILDHRIIELIKAPRRSVTIAILSAGVGRLIIPCRVRFHSSGYFSQASARGMTSRKALLAAQAVTTKPIATQSKKAITNGCLKAKGR